MFTEYDHNFQPDTTLYVIRHCKAVGQEPEAALSELGISQAEQLTHSLGSFGIDRIVSSPFVRAVQSIEPLARQLNVKVETDIRLRERVLSTIDYPDWRERLESTFEQLDLHFTGGESSREAMQRASAVVQDILKSREGRNIAIVTHGNLTALLLKTFDPAIGFSTWEGITNPDAFRVQLINDAFSINRVDVTAA